MLRCFFPALKSEPKKSAITHCFKYSELGWNPSWQQRQSSGQREWLRICLLFVRVQPLQRVCKEKGSAAGHSHWKKRCWQWRMEWGKVGSGSELSAFRKLSQMETDFDGRAKGGASTSAFGRWSQAQQLEQLSRWVTLSSCCWSTGSGSEGAERQQGQKQHRVFINCHLELPLKAF